VTSSTYALPSATTRRATLRQIRLDLALQVADARLARVPLDDRLQRVVGERDVGRQEPRALERLRTRKRFAISVFSISV